MNYNPHPGSLCYLTPRRSNAAPGGIPEHMDTFTGNQHLLHQQVEWGSIAFDVMGERWSKAF
jgi:hypothetical protein